MSAARRQLERPGRIATEQGLLSGWDGLPHGCRRGPSINGVSETRKLRPARVTGRDIMDHLIAGVRDPKALAQLARTRTRRKLAELEEALETRSSSPPGTPRCRGSCWSASTGSPRRSPG